MVVLITLFPKFLISCVNVMMGAMTGAMTDCMTVSDGCHINFTVPSNLQLILATNKQFQEYFKKGLTKGTKRSSTGCWK